MAETVEKIQQLKKHLERYFERESVEEKVSLNKTKLISITYTDIFIEDSHHFGRNVYTVNSAICS